MTHRLLAGLCTFLLLMAPAAARGQLRTELVVDGLSSPVGFLQDPTSPTRFFIVEQGGLIRVLDNGVLLPTPLLDLRPPVIRAGGEEGLLGMAFAPDAATTGRFFVTFTNPAGDIVISRFRREPATALTVDIATRFDLVWPGGVPYIPHPGQTNHNGGHLAFGPDGFLYVGLGDGGGGNDTANNAQTPTTLLGKMVRVDVSVDDMHPTGYVVPPTNPFLDGQPIAALGEIWAFGLRNPWRYSFDDFGPGATGALIIGDVGQGAREEVNYEPAGAGGRNYGWRIREGSIPTPGVPPTTPAFTPLQPPLFDYTRDIGRAVTGGYVYRGSTLPPFYRGRYFVADFVTSRVGSLGLTIDPGTGEATVANVIDHTAELASAGALGGIASFARDAQGELYLLTFAGRVLRIVAETPAAPTNLGALIAGSTVSFTWSPPSGGVVPSGYRLEAGSGPGQSNLAVLQTGTTPALAVTGVPDGIYYVRVRAERAGGAGPPSNELRIVVATACTVPPGAPSGLAHTVNGTTVSLSWSASADGSNYVVEAGSSPGASNLAQLVVGAGTSLQVAAPPGAYYVRVRAYNTCGGGPASNEVLVTVP